jgi:hypothetical protein
MSLLMQMQSTHIYNLWVFDLAIFKSYPYLRKPMSSAFDLAWSILKALPEQQAFSQHMDIPRNYQDDPMFHSRYADGYIRQNRRGTVPPPIIGAMGRTQAIDSVNPEFALATPRMNVVPEGKAVTRGQLVDKPENINPFPPFYEDTPTTMPKELTNIEEEAQLDRGSLFRDYKPYLSYDLSRRIKPERPEWHLDHPPKEPLDTDAMFAYLQSIGF